MEDGGYWVNYRPVSREERDRGLGNALDALDGAEKNEALLRKQADEYFRAMEDLVAKYKSAKSASFSKAEWNQEWQNAFGEFETKTFTSDLISECVAAAEALRLAKAAWDNIAPKT